MLDHLEDNIRRVIAHIRPQMLEKVIESRTSRLDYIRAIRGSPMPEIIFKISIPLKKDPLLSDLGKGWGYYWLWLAHLSVWCIEKLVAWPPRKSKIAGSILLEAIDFLDAKIKDTHVK
ncbi:hypothetical protein TNCV_4181651 [Trichonephila clavipes]|nr:hypothetical protein TNCV_4181651 [Trichonephila clavipes]